MCTLMITVHLGSGLLKFRLKKITLITVKSTVTFFPLHEIMWPEQFGKWWGYVSCCDREGHAAFWIWLPENFGVDSMQHPRRHMPVHTRYLVVRQKNDKRERTLAVELRRVVRGEGLRVSFMFLCCFPEDPVAARASLRAESKSFVDVSQEEFQSVSELVRVRLKLSEVNAVSDCAQVRWWGVNCKLIFNT